MGISKCQECNSTFDWFKLIKHVYFISKRRPLHCSHCKTNYYIGTSFVGKTIYFFYFLFFVTISILNNHSIINNSQETILLVLLFLAFIITYPLGLKQKK